MQSTTGRAGTDGKTPAGASSTGMRAYDISTQIDQVKGHTLNMARSDVASVLLHVWNVGSGEVKEHAHYASDANWLVLRGNVTFYQGEEVIAELAPEQGLFVPRGQSYWFKNTGSEPLVMLRTAALAETVPYKAETGFKDDRVFVQGAG